MRILALNRIKDALFFGIDRTTVLIIEKEEMTMNKQVATSIAVLGLVISAGAQADPLFPQTAPQSTVDFCVQQISDYADYNDARVVRHEIESEELRSIGHKLRIDTRVYGDTEDQLIREYATTCSVGNSQRTLAFRIRETGTN